MKPEYALKISLTNHKHDSSKKPYYWSISRYDGIWHQIAFGWEESPKKCFHSAMKYYVYLTSCNN